MFLVIKNVVILQSENLEKKKRYVFNCRNETRDFHKVR